MRLNFLRELKRRRVLHTASLYVVGAWIALQVVEVLSAAGLPPSTMRNLLVILSAGFPLVLVFGWFFDISRDGIIRTPKLAIGEHLPKLKFMDYLLLTGLLCVVVIDTWILSIPAVVSPPSPAMTDGVQQRTIAVLAFEDSEAGESEDIGEAFADELRSSLTRVAGIRVLGPETSKALDLAGDGRNDMARELFVTALLLGEVLLDGERLHVSTRLVDVPSGNELWSNEMTRPVVDAIRLQESLLSQVVQAVSPGLDPDPALGPRAEAGACSSVYDIYLRGKQLSKARRQTQANVYQRGMQLLREAVAADDQCALAWEAIAVGELNWTKPGLARAGAAARRALELNDTLPEAWTILAEIAEEESHWNQSEEYFLRAIYADPTNTHANYMYSEALLARGRLRDALHYALEAYRYEPASLIVNFRIVLTASFIGDADLAIKHAEIWRDIQGSMHPWLMDFVAEAQLQKGNVERALDIYQELGDRYASWFPDCVRARGNPALAADVLPALEQTLARYETGSLDAGQTHMDIMGNIVRCAIWLDQPDLVFELLDVKGTPGYEAGFPTEVLFANMFWHDGASLRAHPRFRRMVVESGLLDYWQKWGWADMCRPAADSFECD